MLIKIQLLVFYIYLETTLDINRKLTNYKWKEISVRSFLVTSSASIKTNTIQTDLEGLEKDS
jgi:hypothetical protein